MKKSLTVLGGLGLIGAAIWTTPALAIDGLTANADITTDYIFRGITQSAKRPAVQGGLDYAFGDTGFTAGTWVSSIDFGDDSTLEWDIYADYHFPIGPVSASVGLYGYVYPNSGNFGPYDFLEYDATLGYDFGIFAWSAKAFVGPSLPSGFLTVRNAYNPDSEYWLTTGVSIPVAGFLAISGNVGYEGYSGGRPAGVSDDSFTEWDIGATFTLDKYSLDLRYIDNSKHTLASYTAPYFATGPFYVATLKFAFP